MKMYIGSFITLFICLPYRSLSANIALRTSSQELLSSATRDTVLMSVAQEAKSEASISATLRGAAGVFAKLGNEAELGGRLGLDLSFGTNRSRGSLFMGDGGQGGPATLAEYCASPQEPSKGVKEGTKVKANWEGYGTMYPGKVSDYNSDGSIDVKYDDGFKEKNVDDDDFKVIKSEGEEAEAKKAAKPRDDPACELQDFLQKLQEQLDKLNKMIAQWLAAQRAKIAGEKTPPPRPKVTSLAAPSAAPPADLSEDEADDIEKLKEQLAEREEYIKELEKQVAQNNEALEKVAPSGLAAPSGIGGIDSLIAEYKAKIADRDRRIDELLKIIGQQENELARITATQLSLKDIDDAVKELEKDVEEAKRKRDELKEKGSLDPELRSIIDSIIKALQKLRKKVDNLIALEAKAKADREKAEREAEEAKEAARKKAEAEGKDPDEAAAEATKKAEKNAKQKARTADIETMKAAQEVEKEMQEAKKGAKQLDTGLHPHGAKWWRYRYERSYIEAMVMIFISWLMLFWSILIRNMKTKLMVWARPAGEKEQSELEKIENESHGAIYGHWLHLLAEQMMVCILVFLTVWLIAKTQLAELFPVIIKPSDDMRVPHTGQEYRELALDICTIFFFAIMFYFCLIFSVANDTWYMTHILEKLETSGDVSTRSDRRRISGEIMGTVASDTAEFQAVKKHFVRHMKKEMREAMREAPEQSQDDNDDDRSSTVSSISKTVTKGFSRTMTHMMTSSKTDSGVHKDISTCLDDDLDKFPLAKYLKFNVRISVVQLFHFGWAMWLPVICLFIVLTLLHRFAHLGYVRIMMFFAAVTFGIIIGIAAHSHRVSAEIHSDSEPEPGPQKWSIHRELPTETIFLGALRFALFVICYGVARMICQPWMWELHFRPVLCLTIVAILSAGLFVWLVSPGLPTFCAMQAIPPYVDHDNLQTMLYIAQGLERRRRSKS